MLALKLFFFIFLFLLFNLSTNTFLLYIINFYCNIVFSPFFSILIAYIFRFFPIFILFPSKTYIFYYDNAGPPYLPKNRAQCNWNDVKHF